MEFECAPLLISSWLPNRPLNLQLRVAVKGIEAWLLADREEIAHFLRVPQPQIPISPEEEEMPKERLINIALHSRSRSIQEDIVLAEGSRAKEGPAYTSRLTEFVVNHWDPIRAANRAPSLKRSLERLSDWIKK